MLCRGFFIGGNLISNKSLQLIQEAIGVYEKLVGKEYILGYRTNQKHPMKTISIGIQEKNFWHLLGCEIDKKLSKEERQKLYADCLQGVNVSSSLNYTRSQQDVSTKHNTFMQVFDFIRHAGVLRICANVPGFSLFSIGAGTTAGLIGYGQDKELYYPKTTYTKSIYDIDPKTSDKICFVLSRPIFSNEDFVVEYEIINGISQQFYNSSLR